MRARVVSKTQLYGSIPGKVLIGQRDGETRQTWDGVGGGERKEVVLLSVFKGTSSL